MEKPPSPPPCGRESSRRGPPFGFSGLPGLSLCLRVRPEFRVLLPLSLGREGRGERSAGRGKRSLPQIGTRLSNAMPLQSTSRAGRVVPFSNDDRCSSEAGRATSHVHPVTLFAPCIWQAPRPAATIGSFWSLQKERAVGRLWKGKAKTCLSFASRIFSNKFLFFNFLRPFLMRVRKRTKKKRALRQGAGFSVNRLRGTNATRWPATP